MSAGSNCRVNAVTAMWLPRAVRVLDLEGTSLSIAQVNRLGDLENRGPLPNSKIAT
jgi:hypothetical protein